VEGSADLSNRPLVHIGLTCRYHHVIDGLVLIRRLRDLPSCCGAPIVFLTTDADKEKGRLAKADGTTAWITKPLRQAEFPAVVRKAIGS